MDTFYRSNKLKVCSSSLPNIRYNSCYASDRLFAIFKMFITLTNAIRLNIFQNYSQLLNYKVHSFCIPIMILASVFGHF